jgi:hypothetical protein
MSVWMVAMTAATENKINNTLIIHVFSLGGY